MGKRFIALGGCLALVIGIGCASHPKQAEPLLKEDGFTSRPPTEAGAKGGEMTLGVDRLNGRIGP